MAVRTTTNFILNFCNTQVTEPEVFIFFVVRIYKLIAERLCLRSNASYMACVLFASVTGKGFVWPTVCNKVGWPNLLMTLCAVVVSHILVPEFNEVGGLLAVGVLVADLLDLLLALWTLVLRVFHPFVNALIAVDVCTAVKGG